MLLHSTSEVGSPALTPKDIAKRARAIENLAYVVSANSAGFIDADLPANSTDGMSNIWISSVRSAPRRASARARSPARRSTSLHCAATGAAGMGNLLSRQRLELFAAVYAGNPVYPANTLLAPDGSVTVPERSHFLETQRKVIERLAALGLV